MNDEINKIVIEICKYLKLILKYKVALKEFSEKNIGNTVLYKEYYFSDLFEINNTITIHKMNSIMYIYFNLKTKKIRFAEKTTIEEFNDLYAKLKILVPLLKERYEIINISVKKENQNNFQNKFIKVLKDSKLFKRIEKIKENINISAPILKVSKTNSINNVDFVEFEFVEDNETKYKNKDDFIEAEIIKQENKIDNAIINENSTISNITISNSTISNNNDDDPLLIFANIPQIGNK